MTATSYSPTLHPSCSDNTIKQSYIPAPTAQCHASNLLLLPDGDLLCAWFGGSIEGYPDICIYMARLPRGEETWQAPKKLTHDHTRSEQNPVLFLTPRSESESGSMFDSHGRNDGKDQPLWLLYTSQKAGNQDSAVVRRIISLDAGHTWSEPEILFSEPGTFIRQPLVTIPSITTSINGTTGPETGTSMKYTYVLPTFLCRVDPHEKWLGNDDVSVVRISSDGGKTWSSIEVPESYGCVHMSICPLASSSHTGTKRYLALYRSRWADNIYSSTSGDGTHWTSPRPTSLPNPNSGFAATTLGSGRVVVVYNHSSREDAVGRRDGLYDDLKDYPTPDTKTDSPSNESAAGEKKGDTRPPQSVIHNGKSAFWGAPRAPLCVAWSDDAGGTWKRRVLEDGDGFCLTNNSETRKNRELSYPSILVDGDGVVHVAFTFWRQRIKYVRLEPGFFA